MKYFNIFFILFLVLSCKNILPKEKGSEYAKIRNVEIDMNGGLYNVSIILAADSTKTNRFYTVVFLDTTINELKAFEVADRVVELFEKGLLPVESGTTGTALYNYYKSGQSENADAERRKFYELLTEAKGVLLLVAKPEDILNKEFFLNNLKKISGCYFPDNKEDASVLDGDITISTCKEDEKKPCADIFASGKNKKGESVNMSLDKLVIE